MFDPGSSRQISMKSNVLNDLTSKIKMFLHPADSLIKKTVKIMMGIVLDKYVLIQDDSEWYNNNKMTCVNLVVF